MKIELYANDRSPNFDHIIDLYDRCGWGVDDGQIVTKAVQNSYASVVAYRGDKAVGFARVISDGVAYALLVDTMVLPEMRTEGIGSELVYALANYCKEQGIFVMKLISSKEGREFYKGIGFKQCPEDEPGMMLHLPRFSS